MPAFVTSTVLLPLRHQHPALPHSPRSRPPTRFTVSAVAAVRGSKSNPYRIAILPGDGAGPAVADAAKKVLNALTSYAELHFEFIEAPYGAAAFEATGSLVTDETLSICRSADAVLRSYQGTARGIGHDGSGSAHLQLRDRLGLFAQFRPVLVYPQLVESSSLRPDVVNNVDMMLVREISAGALGSDSIATESDESQSQISYSKDQVAAIARAALQVAQRRSGRLVNVDKADAMSVSRFWRKELHRVIDTAALKDDGIAFTDMYVDDFVREVILRPTDFDVVVTSNLFGDILAEVIAALAGPQRVAPSSWVNAEGLGIYGPADIYNAAAYPDGSDGAEMSPIAMIRAASMMLRYTLDEPAAADIIQQALRKAMADVATPGVKQVSSGGNGNGKALALPVVSADEYADVVSRSMQLMHQYEQVCDPTECGE